MEGIIFSTFEYIQYGAFPIHATYPIFGRSFWMKVFLSYRHRRFAIPMWKRTVHYICTTMLIKHAYRNNSESLEASLIATNSFDRAVS